MRLEAGLCLHGNDITPSITPFEAGLMWTVQKKSLTGGDRLNFIGESALRNQVDDVKSGVFKIRKRVGFMIGTFILLLNLTNQFFLLDNLDNSHDSNIVFHNFN